MKAVFSMQLQHFALQVAAMRSINFDALVTSVSGTVSLVRWTHLNRRSTPATLQNHWFLQWFQTSQVVRISQKSKCKAFALYISMSSATCLRKFDRFEPPVKFELVTKALWFSGIAVPPHARPHGESYFVFL